MGAVGDEEQIEKLKDDVFQELELVKQEIRKEIANSEVKAQTNLDLLQKASESNEHKL